MVFNTFFDKSEIALPGQVHLFTGLALPVDGSASRFSVIGRVPQDVVVGQSHSDFIVLKKPKKSEMAMKPIITHSCTYEQDALFLL